MKNINQWSFRTKLWAGIYSILGTVQLIQLFALLFTDRTLISWIVELVITTGVAFLLIRFLESALTESIEHISRVALNISKGDFSQRVQIETNDVIGELGKSFNQMTDKLRGILTDTSGITRQVTEASISISNKSLELKEVIGQVTLSAGELASGSNAISEDVSDMAGSIQAIETKVENYAGATKVMNDRSKQMIQLVEKGRQAVESQSEGMVNNIEATKAVAATIDSLAQQAVGITKITHTIKEIAEQTNLLSLNASIEAARAGEHGRGFAVVAQQVRNLAEEATQSTKEVFNLVRSIEAGIKEAITNIKTNEVIVDQQNRMIDETAQVFNEIVGSVQYITEQIEAFSQESDIMLEGAQKISGAIENISAITQESAAGTEQVSASMNEQLASVQAVAEQAEEMKQIVNRLQRTINVFRLE